MPSASAIPLPSRFKYCTLQAFNDKLHDMTSTLVNGFILGWSVAWPPGPVNAEMIRRGLVPRREGGGFWAAWRVGLGACTGDFIWALAVIAGAGVFLNRPNVRVVLGVVSLALLLVLAVIFSLAAWRMSRRAQTSHEAHLNPPKSSRNGQGRGGYLLGLTFALSSPWNIGFWLAVIGSQQANIMHRSFTDSLTLACAVVFGAVAFTIVLCVAVRSGARFFARPVWQVWTQVLTAGVMIYFAAKLAFQLVA
jgi:threonine/homoserine/homoserine lactone efflux protein